MSAQAAVKVATEATYDEVPYDSFAYPQTHPSHLYTVGTLFGLTPPNFETARILELGCASGGNILPLALLYPKATFVGVDLSLEQIAQANVRKQSLGVNNIEFLQQDLMNFSPKNKAEKFDYIICHGVLSWVPETVREKVFAICEEWLSPNGLAVVSYNALPGWNAVRSLREMMIYHTSRFTSPVERLQQAQILLLFLAENVPADKTGYRGVIEDEIKQLREVNNGSYMYHDHLENVNAQFYLHEFVGKAKAHGLTYVGDTNVGSMYIGNMAPKVLETLQAIDDVVAQEQYMDFVLNRRFRSSIICKDAQKLNRRLQPENIMNYFLTLSPIVEIIGSDPMKDIVFKAGDASFTTHDAINASLFLELNASGLIPLSATELVERVQKKLGLADSQPVRAALVACGLSFVMKGFLNLHSAKPACVTEVSKKPVAFPVTRHEARFEGVTRISNALCQMLSTNEPSNIVLRNMDGTKTVQDLAGILVDEVKKGVLALNKNGVPVKGDREVREEVENLLAELLPKFAKNGLLIG